MSYPKWYRSPSTFPARREAAGSAVDTEDSIPVRAKRNAKNLPTNWDDIKINREKESDRSIRRGKPGFRETIRRIENDEADDNFIAA